MFGTSQIEASTSSPGQPPGHLNFEDGLVQMPPPWGKSRSNAPPISTEIPSPQKQISSLIKHRSRFSERDMP